MWDLVGLRTTSNYSIAVENHRNIQGKSTLYFFQEKLFNSDRMAVLPCNTCHPIFGVTSIFPASGNLLKVLNTHAKVYLPGLSLAKKVCLYYEPEMCANLDEVNHNIFYFLPNKYDITDHLQCEKMLTHVTIIYNNNKIILFLNIAFFK